MYFLNNRYKTIRERQKRGKSTQLNIPIQLAKPEFIIRSTKNRQTLTSFPEETFDFTEVIKTTSTLKAAKVRLGIQSGTSDTTDITTNLSQAFSNLNSSLQVSINDETEGVILNEPVQIYKGSQPFYIDPQPNLDNFPSFSSPNSSAVIIVDTVAEVTPECFQYYLCSELDTFGTGKIISNNIVGDTYTEYFPSGTFNVTFEISKSRDVNNAIDIIWNDGAIRSGFTYTFSSSKFSQVPGVTLTSNNKVVDHGGYLTISFDLTRTNTSPNTFIEIFPSSVTSPISVAHVRKMTLPRLTTEPSPKQKRELVYPVYGRITESSGTYTLSYYTVDRNFTEISQVFPNMPLTAIVPTRLSRQNSPVDEDISPQKIYPYAFGPKLQEPIPCTPKPFVTVDESNINPTQADQPSEAEIGLYASNNNHPDTFIVYEHQGISSDRIYYVDDLFEAKELNRWQSTGSNNFFLSPVNNVGINTDSPTTTFDVNGNGRFRSITSGTSAGALHYTANGTLTTSTSDKSLKENIKDLQSPLNKVLKLRGVSYSWKRDSENKTHLGLIAQEVEKIVPELVFNNPVDNLKGVHYTHIPALLIEAIKEQQKQINELKKQLNK